LINQILEYVKW